MFRRLTFIVSFAFVLFLSAEAWATSYGTVRANFQQVNPSSDIEIHYPGGSYSHSGGAGIFRYLIDRGHTDTTWSKMDIFDAGSSEWFGGFCMELAQYTNGWATYTAEDLAGTPVPGVMIDDAKADLLSEFWGRYGPAYGQWDLWAGWNNGDYAEAFQVGIWEIIYEDSTNGYDVMTGDVWVNSGKIQYGVGNINNWLGLLDGTGPMATLRAITHPNYQDVLVVVPDPESFPGLIPEPLTIMGVFMGGVGLVGYIRRRRKTA